MKRYITFLIIALAVMAILPSASYAFNNRLEIEIMGGSGELKVPPMSADIEMGMFGAGYTRYFNSLETTDSPYGMREFLQHPSYLAVGLESQAMDITVDSSPISMESTETTFTVDGMYYFQGGTGIGATLESISGEEETKVADITVDKDEITDSAFTLSVNHYITDTISAGVSITSMVSETKNNSGAKEEYDGQTLRFGVSALINNFFWVSCTLGGGTLEYDPGPEFDTSVFELEVGAFPMQRLGLFLGVSVEKEEGTDYESTGTFTRLTADFSVTKKVNIMGSLYSMKEEVTDAGTDGGTEMTGLQVAVGVLF